jgi:hypothetical protein
MIRGLTVPYRKGIFVYNTKLMNLSRIPILNMNLRYL